MLTLAAIALTACTPAYQPYAVDDLRRYSPIDQSLPVVAAAPVETTTDHRAYKAATGSETYLVPSGLTLSVTPSGRRQAVSFEGSSGAHLFLVANVSSPKALGATAYPIRRLDIRTITDTMTPERFRVTAVPGAVERAPFSAIVVIQVLGRENVEGFKKLLRSGAGFLLEARFNVAFEGLGTQELSIPISIDQAGISEQTI